MRGPAPGERKAGRVPALIPKGAGVPPVPGPERDGLAAIARAAPAGGRLPGPDGPDLIFRPRPITGRHPLAELAHRHRLDPGRGTAAEVLEPDRLARLYGLPAGMAEAERRAAGPAPCARM